MEQVLERIQKQKTLTKSQLNKQNLEYLKVIYKGFLKGKSARELAKELYDMTIDKNYKGLDESIELVSQIKRKLPRKEYLVQVVVNKCPRYIDSVKTENDALAIMLFGLLDTIKAYPKLRKVANERANEVESESKTKEMAKALEDNRKQEKVFYIASSHKDCAQDHLDFQGRIYYDEKWESVIKDDKLKEKVRHFIEVNKLKSFQWVVDKPVFLITRPNCRHYFKELPVKEVLGKTNAYLLKKYNMYRVIGDRQYVQTMVSVDGETRKLIGEYRNAELMYERYKERMEYHKALYKINGNPFIRDAIEKDRFLLAKWRRYMKMYKGE